MQKPLDVTIGNRSYRLSVEDGQESRVQSVALMLDGYIEKMSQSAGGAMDRDRLLVMAGIMMADDFFTLQQEKDMEEQTLASFHNALASRLEELAK